jgi:very-short-patch-repair endonuclease
MPTPIQAARELRRRMTPGEKLLWQNLRAHRFGGYKFRRQHPLVYQVWKKQSSFYVADFYCAGKKIVIGLDGKHHEFPDQKEYDVARDKLMQEFGIKILRIKNEELKDLRKVLEKIGEMI